MTHSRARSALRCALALALVAFVPTACRSIDPEYRTEVLRELYPAGVTSRDDVRERWNGSGPLLTAWRPYRGWVSSSETAAAERALEVAERTGLQVELVERYWGADGISGGLCYCWYFYDAECRVIDVAWQWCSD